MQPIIEALQKTPVSTILIVFGLLFLLLGLVNKVGGFLEVSAEQKRWTFPIGLLVLTIGLALYFLSASSSNRSDAAAHEADDSNAPLTGSKPPEAPVAKSSSTSDVSREIEENVAKPTGSLPPPTLPYGPNQCKDGYVFRDAWPNDQVCVTPSTRAQVARDNAASSKNISPGPIGDDQCRNGLVWREARPSDHVCALPAQRDQARTDNYYDYSRKQIRLINRGKPVPPPSRSTAYKDIGDLVQFRAGAGGIDECKARYECPPRMKMAVEDEICVCQK